MHNEEEVGAKKATPQSECLALLEKIQTQQREIETLLDPILLEQMPENDKGEEEQSSPVVRKVRGIIYFNEILIRRIKF